jgi:S1-C subfamily serine protease
MAGGNGTVGQYSDDEALDAYSRVVTGVCDRILPSVASLKVMRRVRGGRRAAGSGSAVVLTSDGYLVTSAHVVVDGQEGTAAFADGREFDFEVVGADQLSELAVVRVGAGDLEPAELGDAGTLRVGQLVVAVGNPLGLAGSVSAGVVSALGRSFVTSVGSNGRQVDNVIQTDAALHPGNSGGALADNRAQVVGINTAVVGPFIGQGLGLAVPIDATTKSIIASLMSHGQVRRSWLGVGGGGRPLPPRAATELGHTHGVEVLSVVAGSPADRGGIQVEDILVTLDGESTADVGQLQRLMTAARIDREVPVVVVRRGRAVRLRVRPTELASSR